ncbi:MAG: NAD(P)-binding protein [Actinomycetia bacterium]|nr:NAD(P)-binding protein [Actinomycetes bacterium]MCH9800005.1 NAD(P)-binding protein [Actinomycetes bacterium]
MTSPRIGVVGGGIAGLVLAQRLAANGVQPVIVDKAKRLGGRLSARPLLGELVPTSVRTCRVGVQQSAVLQELLGDAAEVGSAADGWCDVQITAAASARIAKVSQQFERHQGLVTHLSQPSTGGVRLHLWGNAPGIDVDAVVLTPPLPQTVQLFDRSGLTVPDPWRTAQYTQRLVLLAEGSLPVGDVPEEHDGWAQVFVDRVADSDQVRLAAYADNKISSQLWDLDVTDAQARLALGLREVLPGLALRTADVKRWRYANAINTADWDAGQPVSDSLPVWMTGDGVGEPSGEFLGVHRAVTSALAAHRGLAGNFDH